MNKQKGFAPIIILVGILVLVSLGGAYYFFKVKTPVQKACTMDAKICPDGSSVGRVGPNCEFAPCPKSSPSPSPVNASREPTGSAASPVPNGAGETANWKTYTNTKDGYTIQFPKEWRHKEYLDIPPNSPYLNYTLGALQRTPYLIPNQTVIFNDKRYDAESNIGIYFQLFSGKKEKTVDEFAERYVDLYIRVTENAQNSEILPRRKQVLSLNNKTILKVTVAQQAGGGYPGTAGTVYSDLWFYMNDKYSVVIIPYALGNEYVEYMIKSLEFQ